MNIVASIVNDIISEHYEYLSHCEKNTTEIEKNIAILKAKSSELQANTQLAEQYFNYQMAERERLFNSASQVLDKAMQTGDAEFAQIAVKIIKIIHGKCPFSF